MGQLLTTDPNLNGRVYKVKEKKSKDSTGERVATLLHLEQYLPNGIMDSNQNHIIIDDMNNEVVCVIWYGMFGDSVRSTITKVCEEAFKLRSGGTRSKRRASTGTYVSAGYTVNFASGK